LGVILNKVKIADQVISFIESIGTKNVFFLPGGGNMYLIDALKRNKKINAIPMHHEQSVGIAAEAYSRVSEEIGVSLVTTGPGATNIITSVAGAWIESSPMIIISGQVKTPDMKKNKPLRQLGVQEVDVVKMIKSITKFSITLKNSKNLKKILEKAYSIAISNRPGPVWIDIPLDIQATNIREIKFKKNNFVRKKKLSRNVKLNFLQKLLRESKRPVFLIGHGARISNSNQIIKKVFNKFSIPFLFTWNAMDLMPYNHKLNFGKPGGVALRYPNFIIQNSDLIISVGSSLDNIITAYNPRNFGKNAKKIMINIDENVLNYSKIKCHKKLKLDAKSFFKNFIYLKNYNKNWINWVNFCKKLKNKYKLEKEKSFYSKDKIKHFELVNALSKYLPSRSIIATGSSGLAIEQFYTFFKNKTGQRIFLTSGLGSMGFGLPAAIGAYFANKKKMFLIEGDGSFQLNIQELAVISKYKIPIGIIIFNNEGYASIRNTQRNYFDGRYCGTGPEADLNFPNFKNLSLAYNLKYYQISKTKKLKHLKKIISNLNYPTIIDIKLEKNESLSPKVSSMIMSDGTIKSMPLEDMSPLLKLNELKEAMMNNISKQSTEVRKNE
jgi:acetolactate synthase-1/2/3 large subunit